MSKRNQRDLRHQAFGWYVRNCTRSPVADKLQAVFLEQLSALKDLASDREDSAKLALEIENLTSTKKERHRRRRLSEFRRVLRPFSHRPPIDPTGEQNVLFARDEFGLDPIDTEILLLQLRYERCKALECFVDKVVGVVGSGRAIEALLQFDIKEIKHRVSHKGALFSTGLLVTDPWRPFGTQSQPPEGIGFQFSPPLRRVMHATFDSREEWIAAILGPSLAPTCSWEDFEHLGSARGLAAGVITGAQVDRDKSINLFLHGPVGNGKTEFCRVLAARAGKSIWSVGECDDSGEEPNRSERLASLRLAQRLLAKRPDALILFDEAEDLLTMDVTVLGLRRPGSGSKVHINRMLETNAVPVLWTCNDIRWIDPAVLRRMTLAIEIKAPNQTARARIWRKVSAETKLPLDDPAVTRLAKSYAAPPGVAMNAARAALLARGGVSEVEEAMSSVLRLLDIAPLSPEADASDFDLSLANCHEDLGALIDRLARPEAPRNWSTCLHGAPGTGKSKFARYLAAKLGMEVVQRRVSDLYSCWVGESEKKIAAAFADARREGHMLVFDEADSLLQDRRNAARSWEITHVNEMLTWMESHPLPFVCTTNFMDNLDPASLRRFTFKVNFRTLTAIQAARAFERFFGEAAPVGMPEGLAPGDFSVVRRKRELLGITDPTILIKWLTDEVTAKGIRAGEIGFAVSQR